MRPDHDHSIEGRMRRLLENTAKEIRPCTQCGTRIYLVEHANGKRAPYTVDGTNHFINCPHADRFRNKKPEPVGQEAMFESSPYPG